MNKGKELIDAILRKARTRRLKRILAVSMAGIVILTTNYSMMLPGISVSLGEAEDMSGFELVLDEAEYERETSDNYDEDIISLSDYDQDWSSGITIDSIEDVEDDPFAESIGTLWSEDEIDGAVNGSDDIFIVESVGSDFDASVDPEEIVVIEAETECGAETYAETDIVTEEETEADIDAEYEPAEEFVA